MREGSFYPDKTKLILSSLLISIAKVPMLCLKFVGYLFQNLADKCDKIVTISCCE